MSTIELEEEYRVTEPSVQNKRQYDMNLILVELEPWSIVDGVYTDEGFLTGDINTAGEVRETCPECKDARLKLVLRQKLVRQSHLFCERCTRCFDAYYPNGASALTIV